MSDTAANIIILVSFALLVVALCAAVWSERNAWLRAKRRLAKLRRRDINV